MIPETLITLLLSFASMVSGLPLPLTPLPQIEITKNFSGRLLGPMGPTEGGPRGSPFYAMTDHQNGHIGLHSKWNLKNTDDVCILAHELTHYLQWELYRLKAGAAVNEPPAYEVTARCFDLYGERGSAAWARGQAEYYRKK